MHVARMENWMRTKFKSEKLSEIFVYGLFNNTLNASVYVATDNGMINE